MARVGAGVGAALGAIGGAVLGGVLGARVGDHEWLPDIQKYRREHGLLRMSDVEVQGRMAEDKLKALGAFAVLGAIVGAIAGAGCPTDTEEKKPQ